MSSTALAKDIDENAKREFQFNLSGFLQLTILLALGSKP
jgi:hypothetical protein